MKKKYQQPCTCDIGIEGEYLLVDLHAASNGGTKDPSQAMAPKRLDEIYYL